MVSQKTFEKDLTTLATLVSLDNKGCGSGIFIADSSEVFFATAKHVLFQEQIDTVTKKKTNKIKANIIDLFFYPKDSDFKEFQQIKVDLVTLLKSSKLLINSSDDICVLKIADIEDGQLSLIQGVQKLSKNVNLNVASYSMVRASSEVTIGDNIYVIGYPKALGLAKTNQYDFNKPLVRNGIIAGKNTQKRTLIIDCAVYGGNSGGPVFTTERVIEMEGTKLIFKNKKYLIGLVSQYIPWVNQTNKKNPHWDNSGYSVIVPFDEIMKLVKTIE